MIEGNVILKDCLKTYTWKPPFFKELKVTEFVCSIFEEFPFSS